MVLFETPSSTVEQVLATVSANLADPGIKGAAVIAIGLVAVFWVFELVIGKLQPIDKNEPPNQNEY